MMKDMEKEIYTMEDRIESDAVHPLTRISSNGEFVEIDEQAPQVLSAATNSEKGGGSRLYKFCYESVKSLVYSSGTGANTSGDHRYDTSDWDDVEDRNEDCIAAKQVAKKVFLII